MSRFFFNLYNDHIAIDPEGIEFDDSVAACECARAEARHLAAESVRTHSHLVKHHHIRVVDESGAEVARVHFGDVVKVIE